MMQTFPEVFLQAGQDSADKIQGLGFIVQFRKMGLQKRQKFMLTGVLQNEGDLL